MNQSETQSRPQGDRAQPAVNIASIFMHGAARMLDIQMAAGRNFMQYQARGARAFGAPDFSEIFKGIDARFYEAMTDQALNYMRQANEAISEMPANIGELIQQQTEELSEQMRQGMEEAGSLMQQGAQEGTQMIKEATREAGEAVQEGEEAQQGQRAAAQRQGGQIGKDGGEREQGARARRAG
ncbi:MAG: phasin family protein [Gammaproteobacteria bacterium]